MEKIAAAALRINGKIYTGKTHFMALRKILDMPNISADEKTTMALNAEDGFVTDIGRFVDRNEAYALASANKQLNNSEFSQPDRNKAFYGTAAPSLDSGLIENYSPFFHRPAYIC
jgi:hypothetical protein